MTSPVGCSTDWAADIYDRITGLRVDTLPCNRLGGEYSPDRFSVASASYAKSRVGADCCAQMGVIRAWRHELALTREGVEVWRGPVTGVKETRNNITVRAADRLAWTKVRRMRTNRTLTGDPATIIAAALFDALVAYDPVRITSALVPTGVTRTITWTEHQLCWDVIKPLIDTAIDVAMIGTTLLGGATVAGTRITGDLDPDVLGIDVATDEDGWTVGTSIAAKGRASTAVWPPETGGVPTVDGLYGLVDQVIDAANLTDTVAAARDAWSQRRNPAVMLASGQSSKLLNFPVPFEQLVPGLRFTLTDKDRCRPLSTTIEIAHLTFGIGSGGSQARGQNGKFTSQSSAEAETVTADWQIVDPEAVRI